jgi:hypothetical protein
VLKKSYDPDADRVCPSAESSRSACDDVCDCNGLSNSPPKDALGNDEREPEATVSKIR